MGTISRNPICKLGCYNESGEYLCTATIATSNDAGANIALQGNNYVSFRDDNGKTWSMQFKSEDAAVEFCAHVAVAMFGACGQPAHGITVCDVGSGTSDAIVLANDRAKVKFRSWIVQSSADRSELPKLGSLLEASPAKPTTVTIPASHQSVTADMKGFEGMLVGMREGAQRVIVIPLNTKRGSGPEVSMCYFVQVVRRKEGAPTPDANATSSSASATPVTTVITGLSREQLLLVEHLRDEVYALTEQLRDARSQLDTFSSAVKQQQIATRPHSLTGAQITASLQQLLDDVEKQRQQLTDQETITKELEIRNLALHQTLERLSTSTAMLADEKQGVVNACSEAKVDLDRQLLQEQSALAALATELEDATRQLRATQNLVAETDRECADARVQLQVEAAAQRTAAEKLQALRDATSQETAQCGQLAAAVGGLTVQLRAMQEQAQHYQAQALEKHARTEAELQRFGSLLREAEAESEAELAALQEELSRELEGRRSAHTAECLQAGMEALRVGRRRGVEVGRAAALVESGQRVQHLQLLFQQNTAEAETLQSRLTSVRAAAATAESSLGARLTVLEETRAAAAEEAAELRAGVLRLEAAAALEEAEARTKVWAAHGSFARPVSKETLTSLLRRLRTGSDPTCAELERQQADREARAEEEEHAKVVVWARDVVYNKPAAMPPLQT